MPEARYLYRLEPCCASSGRQALAVGQLTKLGDARYVGLSNAIDAVSKHCQAFQAVADSDCPALPCVTTSGSIVSSARPAASLS